jgi:uncharacterized SAM-binding protein YcdF (DUF218 family)
LLTIREKFISIVDNDLLVPSDAVILLEGDGFNRYLHAVDLYKQNRAKKIVFSGGATDYSYGSFPFEDIYPRLVHAGVHPDDIIYEENSQNTKEQANEAISLAIDNGWNRLILVASCEHQYRAYLTFLKRIIDEKLDIAVFNSPAENLSWFNECEWGVRCNRLDQEFERIDKYTALGHLADYEGAIEYQRWKEKLILR